MSDLRSELEAQREYTRAVRRLLSQKYNGETPLCYCHSFGCQGNVSDGEKLRGMLSEMGYGFTDNKAEAKLILYNTCAVREHAEQRVFGMVGQLKKIKQDSPDVIVGVCGCMVQQAQIAEKLQKSYPYVDLLFGTHVLHKLPEFVYRVLTEEQRLLEIPDSAGVITEGLPIKRESDFAASVSIMYGCNNFCSYCIVPYVRGRERSRTPKDILNEVKGLVNSGYREILLLGQNVNSYGKTLEEPTNFPGLLRQIAEIPGDFWVRFMTSHPKDATHELFDVMAENEKICPHIHLPVQSGSDKVLKDMHRGYTSADYLRILDYARAKIPNLSVTTDLIVGFPTETEADFADTLKLVETAKFDNAYTFLYSRREGTAAAKLTDCFTKEERADRFARLLKLFDDMGDTRYAHLVGQKKRVLVQKEHRQQGMLLGKTAENTLVEVEGERELIGTFAEVEIIESMAHGVRGTLTK